MISVSQISKREHLESNDNVAKILKAHFQDGSVRIVSIDRGNKNPITEGINNNFQSELEKWKIKFKRDGGGKEEVVLATILKAPIPTFFHKIISKLNKSFMREVFWYRDAYPAFKSNNPIVETTLSAVCYHGFTKYDEEYRLPPLS